LGTIKQLIVRIITTRPISTMLAKASSDYIFFTVYLLLIGLAIIGIVNLSLHISGRSKKAIAAVNIILAVLLLAVLLLANILFYIIRGN